MSFLPERKNDNHRRNIEKILQHFDLVDIFTEDGQVYKFPLILLCIQSEMIASILSELPQNETFNISVPIRYEALADIQETLINH